MRFDDKQDTEGRRTAADRYVASDAGEGARELDAWIEVDAEHAGAIARCEAVMALAPTLRERTDLAWAFEEARRLAATPPPAAREPRRLAWYRRAGPAWGIAALATVVAAAAVTFALAPGGAAPALGPDGTGAAAARRDASAAALAPLDELRVLPEGVEPVVLIADQVAVAGPSIAVLPFTSVASTDAADAAAADAAAQSIYEQISRQLAAIPGLYVIDPRTAASYAGVGAPEEIALWLGVRGIVEGRVTADRGDVTLELTFTDAARDGLAIEASYERRIEEIALLRDDVTDSLIAALAGRRMAVTQPEIPPGGSQ